MADGTEHLDKIAKKMLPGGNGKGDWKRKQNKKQYDTNFDQIRWKPKTKEDPR